MTKLHLAQSLSLPIDAAGETFLIVGKRGSGKSSTATRFAEQLVRAKVPIAVLDPVDVWWGLKAGGDGKREGGLEVYIFGGDHADLPLESTAGTLIADVVVDHRVNVVMVLRAFSNREKARFVSDFAEQLYKRNRDTMHLFCEEAHEVMPQNPYAGEEEMLGRMLRLEKQGRTSGIGMTAITQRPASLNKNATTQAEILVAHRILGPQDIKAVDGWIQHHHQQDKRQEVLATLGELKTGEAWVWAPDFPEDDPIGLKRVQVLLPETFDSRRTPKPGEHRTQPKELAQVDLERLRQKMASTIERAKADDPKALRARIRELEAMQRITRNAAPTPASAKTIEIAVLKNGALKDLRHISEQWVRASEAMLRAETAARERTDALKATALELGTAIRPVISELNRITSTRSVEPSTSVGPGQVRRETAVDGSPVRAASHMSEPKRAGPGATGLAPSRRPSADVARTAEGVSGPQQRMLDALAWLETVGIAGAKWSILGFLSNQSPKSSGFEKNVSTLRSSGLLEGNGKTQLFRLTEAGERVANVPDVAVSSEELQRQVYAKISTPQERMLRALVASYPRNLTWDELAAKGEQSPTSSGFEKNVSTLKSFGLIDGGRATGFVAMPQLFIDERAYA